MYFRVYRIFSLFSILIVQIAENHNPFRVHQVAIHQKAKNEVAQLHQHQTYQRHQIVIINWI